MRLALGSLLFALTCSFGCPAKSSGPTGPTGPTGSGSDDPVGSNAGSGSADQPAGDCVCNMMYAPVCGKDGKTYGNACAAGCAKVEIASQGECPK